MPSSSPVYGFTSFRISPQSPRQPKVTYIPRRRRYTRFSLLSSPYLPYLIFLAHTESDTRPRPHTPHTAHKRTKLRADSRHVSPNSIKRIIELSPHSSLRPPFRSATSNSNSDSNFNNNDTRMHREARGGRTQEEARGRWFQLFRNQNLEALTRCVALCFFLGRKEGLLCYGMCIMKSMGHEGGMS